MNESDPLKEAYASEVMSHVERFRAELKDIPETEETQELRDNYQRLIEGLLAQAERGPIRVIRRHSTFNRSPQIRQIRSTFGRGFSRYDC